MTKWRNGLVAGRFQPLHLGHVEYIMAAFDRCDHLYIGITHPDRSSFYKSKSSTHRYQESENPFPYEVRHEMVEGLMADYRIKKEEYDVIPLLLGSAEDCRARVPSDTVMFVTIYDDWGEEKKRLFEDMGFSVEILWRRRETVTSGMDVRARIRAKDRGWEHLLPSSTQRVVSNWLAAGNVLEPAEFLRGPRE